MATQADIGRLREALGATTDLDALEDLLLDCQELLESLFRSIDRTDEEDVRQHVRALKGDAEELRVDIKRKILEAKADRADPEFTRRWVEESEDQSRRLTDEMEGLPGALGDGIANIVRSIAQAVEPHIRRESAGQCPECEGDLVPGAKFCPECGAAIPQEQKCPSCGAKLDPRFKYCPECGAKRS